MIHESAFWFGDTRVQRFSQAEESSEQALIVFHGFPGQPPRGQEEKYRGKPKLRVELANAVAARLGWDVYLPGYDGLGGSRGRFSFEGAVTRSVAFAHETTRKHKRLHVAGHSWGAFVAVNAHAAPDRTSGALVLLSGLLDLPDEAAVRAFLPYYIDHYPDILGDDPGALKRAIADLDAARRRFNPMNRAAMKRASEKDLQIVSSRGDTYVSPEASRRFHERFGGRLIEVDDDHGYSANMPRVIDDVVSFLQ